MKSIAFILLIALVCAAQKPRLQFNKDGTFKILQMSDLHCGEDEEKDVNTTRVMRTLIDAEKPDFLAFSGDMVSGYAWDGKTPNWYKSIWDRWTKAIYEKKVPYGYTLGNHDNEADLSRREIVQLDMQNPYSLTQLCDESIPGASNYYIPVYSSKDNNTVAMNIWFFDSLQYNYLDVAGFGSVPHEAIDWYLQTSRRLEKEQGGKKPGVAFMHIPPQEWMFYWNHYDSVGGKQQLVKCQSVNTGLMAAFLERKEMVAIFTGHDHKNDYAVEYKDILIGYTRKTGYGSYGPADGKQRGGRILSFIEDEFAVKSYIIQEDGTIDVQEPQPDKGEKQDFCDFMNPPHSIYENIEL